MTASPPPAPTVARIVRSFLAMVHSGRPNDDRRRRPSSTKRWTFWPINLRVPVAVERDLLPGPPALLLDSGQIHQVLLNLIVNAQHAPRKEDRRIRISVSGGREDHLALIISDNARACLPSAWRVFDPFFNTKPQGSGTGIGLVVSGPVEAHGAMLELDDAPEGLVHHPPRTTASLRISASITPFPAAGRTEEADTIIDDEADRFFSGR